MRKLLPLLAAIPTAALLAFIFPTATPPHPSVAEGLPQATNIQQIKQLINQTAIRCSPSYNPFASNNNISPLTGWGNYKWPIKTASDSAQFYFNQGISMYYAFHIIEARASFAKVVELDPLCAMGWWGLALSFGPNINDFGYTAPAEALAAARKAASLSNVYTPKEKALIYSINTRYSEDTARSRESLNQDYAAAMKQAFKDLPQDADIATLYADALMLLHPWDLYDHNSKPKPWTPELVQVLEKALKLNPNNPGANHYYIHAVEASENPGRALPSADRLPGLMPDVSHLVHMPSHIYIRTGNYEKGAALNISAVKGYAKYLRAFPAVQENAALYNIHNLHMQAACNMMTGNFKSSITAALETSQGVPQEMTAYPGPFGHFAQYWYATPILTLVRFGKWDDILGSRPMDSLSYANILLAFAKGMAFAKTGQPNYANLELTKLRVKMYEDESLRQPFTPFNSAYNTIRVAEHILAGTMAEQSGQLNNAIQYFQKGVELEDALIYNEPRDWLLPVRHYLGNALLKAGKPAEAEAVFKKDLQINPLNVWALRGLHQAQTAQRKTADAAKTLEQLNKIPGSAEISNAVY
jgi:tetratricopeptide (TPR) repeat protein